jgi:anti-sigma factor RsiW
MSELSPLSDAERAELVAYLDGELNEAASRKLEARLSSDPRVRAEADALRRTWELLDYLPRPAPSADFTHRTLDRVSALRPAVTSPAGHQHWWLIGVGWAAALVLSAAAGYAAMTAFAPKEPPGDEELVRDLRVIENKHYYEAADDLDFLRELDHPDQFGEDSLGS